MALKYQTLSQFILNPFNQFNQMVPKDEKYNIKYMQSKDKKEIHLKAVSEIENSFYYLITIDSESQKGGISYDVVIRFFTDDPKIAMENHVRNHYIQFFSNSPGFIYQYAYLYNKHGFLIQALADKIDRRALDSPPEKTNKDMNLSYDRSIYFATRFLSEGKFKYLDKGSTLLFRKTPKQFFNLINSTEAVQLTTEILNAEKLLSREVTKTETKQTDRDRDKIKAKGKALHLVQTSGGRKVVSKAKKQKILPTRSTRKR